MAMYDGAQAQGADIFSVMSDILHHYTLFYPLYKI